MGNEESGTSTNRVQIDISSAPRSNSQFYKDSQMSSFVKLAIGKPLSFIQTTHDKITLLDLIMNCYDEIEDKDGFYEALVSSPINKDDQLNKSLNDEFGSSQYYTRLRNQVTKFVTAFSPRFFRPWNFIFKPNLTPPTFSDIIKGVKIMVDYYNKQISEPDISTLPNYFLTALPPTAMPPPTKDFTRPIPGITDTFNATVVSNHGITSNGHFIFVLANGDTIYVFPILNGGAIGPSFSKALDIKFQPSASIVATQSQILIYNYAVAYYYSIQDFFKEGVLRTKSSNTVPNGTIGVGDGVIHLEVLKNYVGIYKEDEFITRFELKPSNAPINRHIPSISDMFDRDDLMIETNGVYIAYFFRIDTTNAVYRVFSLKTGLHVKDEQIISADPHYTATVDSINRCHFVIGPHSTTRLSISRYHFAGSFDPYLHGIGKIGFTNTDNPVHKVANGMYHALVHLMGSQVIPKLLLVESKNDFHELLQLTTVLADCPDNNKLDLLIALITLLDLNMQILESADRYDDEIRFGVMSLIAKLPTNLAVMFFFGNINLIMKHFDDTTLQLLVNLLDQELPEDQFTFAIRACENCPHFANIKTRGFNPFMSIFMDQTEALLPLVFAHQKVLVSSTYLALKEDPYIEVDLDRDDFTVLDNCCYYIQMATNNFLEFPDSVFNRDTFENLLYLLPALTDFHTVAQNAAPYLAEVLRYDTPFKNFVTFIFSRFMATLIMGGIANEFETKIFWLVKANIGQKGVEQPPDEAKLLELMGPVYNGYKKPFHRNLKDDVKQLDALVLAAICKYTGKLDMLFKSNVNAIKKEIDQMIRIRNYYKAEAQKGTKDVNLAIISKAKFLLELADPKEPALPADVGDLLMTSKSTKDIKEIILAQEQKTESTLTSFKLLEATFALHQTPTFGSILSFSLGTIESFAGLSNILKLTKLNDQQLQDFTDFFIQIQSLLVQSKASYLGLFIYRFFRDIDSLPALQKLITEKSIEALKNDYNNIQQFGICLALLSKSTFEFPTLMTGKKISPLDYLLKTINVMHVGTTEEFTKDLLSPFNSIQTRPIIRRPLVRLVLTCLCSPQISDEFRTDFFKKTLHRIGRRSLNFEDVGLNSEHIWLLRKIIKDRLPLYPLLESIILSITPESNEKEIAGVLTLLGSHIEYMGPYNKAVYHATRTDAREVIQNRLPSIDNQYICYSLPITLTSDKQRIKDSGALLFYAIPRLFIEYEDFPYKDFVLSFKDVKGTALQSLFAQLIAQFSKSQEFCESIPRPLIKSLSKTIVTFQDLHDVLNTIGQYKTMERKPDHNGFSVVSFKKVPQASFISPVLKDQDFDLEIKVSSPNFTGSIGIVTDTVDKTCTRYNLITIPEGHLYPNLETRSIPKQVGDVINVKVRPKEQVIEVLGCSFTFPPGESFRILVATPESNNPVFTYPEGVFRKKSKPTIFERHLVGIDNTEQLTFIKEGRLYSRSPTRKQKRFASFIYPPNYIPTHVGYATEASDPILNDNIRGLTDQYKLQWNCVSLVRIMANAPSKIDDESLITKLFITLIVQLENFSQEAFVKGTFPFAIDAPIWDSSCPCNKLYLNLEVDSRRALNNMITKEHFVQNLAKAARHMSLSSEVHLICHPQTYHSFFPMEVIENKARMTNRRRLAIIAPNHMVSNYRYMIDINKKFEEMPYNITNGPAQFTIQSQEKFDLSALELSTLTNAWVEGTSFEILLLLKNLIYLSNGLEKLTIKSILIDCYICNSPFIKNYLTQFLDFMQTRLYPSPFDVNGSYLNQLRMVKIQTERNSEAYDRAFMSFYNLESSVLNSRICRQMAEIFPDLFGIKAKPKDIPLDIPDVPIEPAAIKADHYMDHLLMIRLYSHPHESIAGLPFWEILPIWQKLQSGGKDLVPPSVNTIGDNTFRVSNPSQLDITITISPKETLAPDALLMRAFSLDFNEPEIYMGADITHTFKTSEAFVFYACVGMPRGFSSITCDVTYDPNSFKQVSTKPTIVRELFISDFKQFAIDWTDEDTNELVQLLPKHELTQETIESTQGIASESNLTLKYSKTVVLLRALLIHHVNYIYDHASPDIIPSAFWVSLKHFLANDVTAEQIAKKILFNSNTPNLDIDRRRAHRFTQDGDGTLNDTIIAQLSKYFTKLGADTFCNKQTIWKIKFIGEEAIDCGGPMREVLTEGCSSIFEACSGITIPTPNGANKTGEFQNLFIPFTRQTNLASLYYAVGVLIGIVVRTGYNQDFPFAPLVWKYIANERITQDDVFKIDSVMRAQMMALKGASSGTQKYVVLNWDGKEEKLPNRKEDEIVDPAEVPSYIKECIDFRVKAMEPFLQSIRQGFLDNTGLSKDEMITGSTLNYLVEGSPIIATASIISYTQVSGYNGVKDRVVHYFFKAFDRFNPEQRKLCLKFITTLTRLPNPVTNPNFCIKIDRLKRSKPDESLPTASTCFYTLHWPEYTNEETAYQKLLVAIQFCQTMELM